MKEDAQVVGRTMLQYIYNNDPIPDISIVIIVKRF